MKTTLLTSVLLLASCTRSVSETETETETEQDEPTVEIVAPVPYAEAVRAPDAHDAGVVPDAAPVPVQREAGVPPTQAAPDAAPAPVLTQHDAGAAQIIPDAAPVPVHDEPCVVSISAPKSPNWVIWVTYGTAELTTKQEPFYCGSTVVGNSCHFSLIGRAYGCRVAVPEKCLPCTGAVIEW